MTSSRIILVIPFEMKEEAKLRKCSWDNENKYWFISSDRYNEDEKFFEAYKRVDLIVPYEQKDIIKKYNGKWDPESKSWYTFKSNENLQDFMKFNDKTDFEKKKVTMKEKENISKKKKVKQDVREMLYKDYLNKGGELLEFDKFYNDNILNQE